MKQIISVKLTVAILFISGCQSGGFFGKGPQSDTVTYKQTQSQWWEANRHRAKNVPGKGNFIAKVGYFDDQGKPLSENPTYEWLTPNQNKASSGDKSLEDESYFSSLLKSSRNLVGAGNKSEKNARKTYQQAEQLFQQKKFSKAKAKYVAAKKQWPDSPLEEDAMFKIGECEFFTDQYPAAEVAYGELLKKYEFSRYLPTCSKRLFAMAQYWVQLHQKDPHYPITPNFFDSKRPRFDTHGRAIAALKTIILKDPTSDLADTAVMALGDSFLNKQNYYEADYYYTLLRRDYPHSKHQFQAHLRGMITKLKLYQGPQYPDGALLEGEKLANQLLAHFPEQIEAERKKVLKIKHEILQNRALKIWSDAQYYDKNKEYRAARMTYQKLVDEFPGTKLSEESQTRIASLKGKPARGPHPFQWASKYLPGADSKKLR